MKMLELYADTRTETIVYKDEVDYSHAYPGRYYLIYCFENDDEDIFTETWLTDTGEYVNIDYGNPVVYDFIRGRRIYENEHRCKLRFLIKIKMPYYFFKKYYA